MFLNSHRLLSKKYKDTERNRKLGSWSMSFMLWIHLQRPLEKWPLPSLPGDILFISYDNKPEKSSYFPVKVICLRSNSSAKDDGKCANNLYKLLHSKGKQPTEQRDNLHNGEKNLCQLLLKQTLKSFEYENNSKN